MWRGKKEHAHKQMMRRTKERCMMWIKWIKERKKLIKHWKVKSKCTCYPNQKAKQSVRSINPKRNSFFFSVLFLFFHSILLSCRLLLLSDKCFGYICYYVKYCAFCSSLVRVSACGYRRRRLLLALLGERISAAVRIVWSALMVVIASSLFDFVSDRHVQLPHRQSAPSATNMTRQEPQTRWKSLLPSCFPISLSISICV